MKVGMKVASEKIVSLIQRIKRPSIRRPYNLSRDRKNSPINKRF
jgi:hypothetical protein